MDEWWKISKANTNSRHIALNLEDVYSVHVQSSELRRGAEYAQQVAKREFYDPRRWIQEGFGYNHLEEVPLNLNNLPNPGSASVYYHACADDC
jgi:hypothetical protein